jgi:putative protease
MATKKKAKGKAKPKRKKTAATKAKAAKAPRRASPKKAKRPAKAAGKRKPAPASPAQPAPPGKPVGVVTHYFGEPSVAIVKLKTGTLRVGDTIHIRGHTTDFEQKVESLQVDHAPVTEVGPKDDFGMKVVAHVREHDVVYKV